MKKQLFSLLCAFALLLCAAPPASALEGESLAAAKTLADLHLIDALPSAKDLENPASRLQAAELLMRLDDSLQPSQNISPQDYASSREWDILFGGLKEAVPAGELCGALLHLLGYEGVDYESAPLFARRVGLITQNYGPLLSLGSLFQLIRDALIFPDKGGSALAQRLVKKGLCTQEDIQPLFPEELNARQIADQHMAAVFRLDSYQSEENYKTGRVDDLASGFFVSPDGLALTNYHSIHGAVQSTATLLTGECFAVEKVVFCDPGADLALLQISKTSTDGLTAPFFSFLELAETPDLRTGDQVYTIGAPLGITLAVSSGIISNTALRTSISAYSCILNTADISRGSSGGALLNSYGHVIGVTSGAYEAGNNLYISIPAAPVLKADWNAEGNTLAEIAENMANLQKIE